MLLVAGLIPGIQADLGVSLPAAGQLVTAFAITYAVGSPLLAILTGWLPRRSLLTGTLATFAATNMLAAAAPTYGVLVLARVLAACGAALFTPTALGVAAASASARQRGRALATVIAGLTVATVLGVPIGTLLATRLGWRAGFVFVAALATLATAGIAALLPPLPAPPVAGLQARIGVATRPPILAILTIVAVGFTGGFALYTYVAPVVSTAADVHRSGLAATPLTFGLAAILGNLLGGLGADRWTPWRTATAAIGAQVLALCLLAALGIVQPRGLAALAGLAIAMVLWGIGAWAVNAPMQKLLVSHAPDVPTVALSLTGSANYAGIALGGVVGGLALHAGGSAAVAPTGGAIELLALALLLARRSLIEHASDLRQRAVGDGAASTRPAPGR